MFSNTALIGYLKVGVVLSSFSLVDGNNGFIYTATKQLRNYLVLRKLFSFTTEPELYNTINCLSFSHTKFTRNKNRLSFSIIRKGGASCQRLLQKNTIALKAFSLQSYYTLCGDKINL